MTLTQEKDGSTSYWPEDDEWTMYVQSGTKTLKEIERMAEEKWPEGHEDGIVVTVENIQTSSLGHDQYDQNDNTNFIVLSIPQPLEKQ